VFKQWQLQVNELRSEGSLVGRLEIRLSKHIGNVSMTLADPEDPNTGMLQITPVLFDMKSPARPCFILNRREHAEMFLAYYSVYDYIFRTADSRSILELP
jgi:hypothetical protein